jgi:signal transduction histidine kinase
MKQQLSVLIIEDDKEDAELAVNYLRKGGYDVNYVLVDNESGMRKALGSQKWDLILSDYSMPEFDVPSALAIYREFDADIPFLVISGAIGEEKAVEMLKAGAHDYLLKDNMKRFVSVVERELREVLVHRELLKANKQLEQLNQYIIDAREEERAIISLEIHDELGQALTALKLDLNWVRGHIHDTTGSVDKLTRMIEMTNRIVKKVQLISSELRPGLLDDLGLESTIEWYCGEFEERSGIKCNLALEELPFEDRKINLSLFRILQEALTNVIRHSGASVVNVELNYLKPVIKMIIEDNGKGIPAEKFESGNSLGLIGMHERAKQCGGNIEFITNNNEGTKVIVSVSEKENKTV